MSKWKKWLSTALLGFLLLPLWGQEASDTAYTFRFVAEEDMFYIPWRGNDKELLRLESCVSRYRERILSGEIPVRVEGWCNSLGSEQANLRMAAVRSNRVKSELITRQGLTEECFITRNHATEGDFVTVRITVPKEDATAQEDEEARLAAERAGQQRKAAEEAERQRLEQERAAREQAERERAEAARLAAEQVRADSLAKARAEAEGMAETASPAAEKTSVAGNYTLSLRTNLLRWATLTPDLGLEWRISPSWGILVNGSWTSWSWQDADRRYALWEVMPEVRWYMGKEKRGYLGAMFKAGEFNYKLSATGKQGDLTGGGITGGYRLQLCDALSLDFSLAAGCLHADYEQYETIGGVRVRAGKETKNWWGPVNAGVTLVWKLF